jgi:hypothetical protein
MCISMENDSYQFGLFTSTPIEYFAYTNLEVNSLRASVASCS